MWRATLQQGSGKPGLLVFLCLDAAAITQ